MNDRDKRIKVLEGMMNYKDRVKDIKKRQADGSYVRDFIDEKEKYEDIAESGLSQEDKEQIAAENLKKKRREMGYRE